MNGLDDGGDQQLRDWEGMRQALLDSLESNGLAPPPSTRVVYEPADLGSGYRAGVNFAREHWAPIALSAVLVTAGASLWYPIAGYVLGAASAVGLVARSAKPVHRFFSKRRTDVGERAFQKLDPRWFHTYDKLDVASETELDEYVYMARVAERLAQTFCDETEQRTLGVAESKIADILAGVNDGHSSLEGINAADFVRMMINQKVGTTEEVCAIQYVDDNVRRGQLEGIVGSSDELDGFIAKHPKLDSEQVRLGVEALSKYVKETEFVLRITNANHANVASQLSRGYVKVKTSTGPNCACYMGMHADKYMDKDSIPFPRIIVDGSVADSFMTNASRGIGLVKGNADHGVLDEATGGIAMIYGMCEHSVGTNANDKDWPLVCMSMGGFTSRADLVTEEHGFPEGNPNSGVFVSFNGDSRVGKKEPEYYKFKDGRIVEMEQDMGYHEFVPFVMRRITDYIAEHPKSSRLEHE